jgi:protein subunit release factor A
MTLYKIDKIILGEGLEEIINGLTAEDEAARLALMT